MIAFCCGIDDCFLLRLCLFHTPRRSEKAIQRLALIGINIASNQPAGDGNGGWVFW